MNDEKDPKIVLGAWAWGNDGTFGHGLAPDELRPVFDAAMNAGLNLWDTAYVYGMGESERMLADFLKDLPRENYRVSDKLTPQCMDASSKTAVADMYEMQLHTMGLDCFDVYYPVLDRLETLDAELENVADSLGINAVRAWEKKMD